MSSDSLIGAVVDGKYRVEALLGRGGMGAVYRAVHAGTDRTVALKVIAGSLGGDPEYVDRFGREARACGRLRHPGIVDVTDFGVARHDGKPLPYLVMEFLDGQTLADALREQPTPPLPWVIDVLEQVCNAVEEAHRHGILHRDLKPENVWLEPDRRGGVNVKVLDFGLAKLEDDGAGRAGRAGRAGGAGGVGEGVVAREVAEGATIAVTMATSIGATGLTSAAGSTSLAGTPAYMSPEQSRGEQATTRSDVYSIGVMAYRMITGRLPFEGSLEEVLTAKREREAPPLVSIRPEVHADAANLVGLALSSDPSRRPASAGVFGNMLAAQLEPASAFFTRAFVLMIGRLSMLARFALLAATPMLVLTGLCALWQIVARLTGFLPYLTGRSAVIALTGLFLGSAITQVSFGAMPLIVLHAMAAPARPVHIVPLLRASRRRLRLYLAGTLPIMGGLLGVLLLLGVVVGGLRYITPLVRTLPRPARAVVVVVGMGAPFALGYKMLRRRGLGVRETGLLGSVLLIEDMPVAAAVKRSAELMVESGGLRNAVQKWYVGIVMVISGSAGALMGAGGAIGKSAGLFLMLSPLVALAFAVFLTVNAVINVLIYVSARRSKGESLEKIYGDLATPQGASS